MEQRMDGTLYSGVSRAAWGYFFLYFHLNVNFSGGTLGLIPSFIGFLLFYSAIGLLAEDIPALALLRKFALLLAVWYGAEWLLAWGNGQLNGWSQFLDLLVCLVELYFHFQFLTNLATLAETYQPLELDLAGRLRGIRTLQVILHTAVMLLEFVRAWIPELWTMVTLVSAVVYFIAGICMMHALFRLRRYL